MSEISNTQSDKQASNFGNFASVETTGTQLHKSQVGNFYALRDEMINTYKIPITNSWEISDDVAKLLNNIQNQFNIYGHDTIKEMQEEAYRPETYEGGPSQISGRLR